MASADYTVIDKILIPDFAGWNIRFATNQLVLCNTPQSEYANKISADNWYKILSKKRERWGHSDPDLDPCGYRSLMVLQLAERYYKKPGLYQKLINSRPQENIRPKSVELISLLQTGHLDYAWEYLSVAVQHNLKYIILPPEINLGDYSKDDFYATATVNVTGKTPGTTMEIKGKSCTYGVTLVKDAPNKEAAVAFLAYLLDEQGGLRILKDMGQPPFMPARVPTENMKNKVPSELIKFVEIKK